VVDPNQVQLQLYPLSLFPNFPSGIPLRNERLEFHLRFARRLVHGGMTVGKLSFSSATMLPHAAQYEDEEDDEHDSWDHHVDHGYADELCVIQQGAHQLWNFRP